MSLPRLTLLLGLVFVLLGVAFWVGTGRQHVTALIPAFLGAPLILLGFWGTREPGRRLPRLLAVGLVALGFLGTARGLVGAARLAGGAEIARPEAQVAQAVVASLSIAYLAYAWWSRTRTRHVEV